MALKAYWCLLNDAVTGETILANVTVAGTSVFNGTTLTAPEPITRATGAPFGSTGAVVSLPYDRSIVYVAGRSDSTGELVAWRVDTVAGTWTELLRQTASSGTWPYAIKLYACHDPAHERVYMVSGNGSFSGDAGNQNPDSAQGVWFSDSAGAFSNIGLGREWPYSGSNINHPNSLTDLYVVEQDPPTTPDIVVTGHTVTWQFSNPPNSYPFWGLASANIGAGATWKETPHSTGLRFVGGWMTALNPLRTDPTEAPDGQLVTNGGGVGPFSFADQNFGVPTNPVAQTAGIPDGTYYTNSRCLVFQDDFSVLVAFCVGSVGQLEIRRYSPIDGTAVLVFSDTDFAPAAPQACLLEESGGAAACLTVNSFGVCHLMHSADYGVTWLDGQIAGYTGLALTEAEPEAFAGTAYEEVLSFRDSRLFVGRSRYYVLGSDTDEARTNAENLASLLNVLTVAHFTQAVGPWTSSPVLPLPGSNDAYNNTESILRLTWLTDDGQQIVIELPCPAYQSFLDDQETLSILIPAVTDLATGAITNRLATRGGLPAVAFIGGTRIMRGFRRKENVRTLGPDETNTAE